MSTLQNNEIDKASKIRNGEPIEVCGITLYPILMSQYELFTACRDALTLRLSSLPVRYMTKDYLNAIFALECDNLQKPETDKKNVGIFYRTMALFYASMRTDAEEFAKLGENVFYAEYHGEIVIDHIAVTNQDGETVNITPQDFSAFIRPLIAEMNGLELPNESQNIDLIKAAEEKKKLNSSNVNLDYNINDLIASVAYHSHCSEREVNSWTVREFESRRRAIDRDKRYMINASAELSGMVKFDKGNPAPSWCFDVLDDSFGTRPLSEIGKMLGGVMQAK